MNARTPDDRRMGNALPPEVPRRWPAAAGWHWLRDGIADVRQQPLAWWRVLVLMLLVWLALAYLRLVFVLLLISPLLTAGLMQFAREQTAGRVAGPLTLFAGLREQTAGLLGLGGLHALALLLILMGVAGGMNQTLGQEALQALAQAVEAGDRETLLRIAGPHAEALSSVALLGLLAYLPVALALWFAPALVLLAGQPSWAALALSARACLRNWLPMLVYGLALMGVGLLFELLARLPALLGLPAVVTQLLVLLLVPFLMAIGAASTYRAYAAIFAAGEQPPGPAVAAAITELDA